MTNTTDKIAELQAENEKLRAELKRREENENRNCINWGPCSFNDSNMNDEPLADQEGK